MSLLRFVPECIAPGKEVVNKFLDVLHGIDRLVVLTGAGISTESGIPDYRSEKVGQYARTDHRPIEHQDFMRSEKWRRRYWARNTVAWPRFSSSKPNATHYAIASWEASDKFTWLITQNVDGLHSRAGSTMVTELHGCGHRVKCMNCERLYPREEVQKWIMEANPDWMVTEIGELAPDGDVPISEHAVDTFQLPHCPHCGPDSILKTDVVFFGDYVPAEAVDLCYEKVEESDGMLILGSSLTVMSGYRFVYHASLRGIPILIVNIGPTRADDIATVKISAKCSDIVKLI